MKRGRNMLILVAVLVALVAVIVVEQVVTEHVDSINTTDEVIVEFDQDDATAITWTYNGTTLTFEKVDGVWYDATDSDFPVDQDAIAAFLAYFEEVHACFVIDDVEDYDQYGLDDPQCTVTITVDGEDIVISMGTYSTMDEQRYISIDDGKVYLIEDDLLAYIVTDRDEFMQNDEIVSVAQLEELTVTGEVSITVVYDEEGSYSYTDSYNYYMVAGGEYYALDDDAVEDFLDDLESVSLANYVTYTATDEDLAEYGLDDPAYTIVVKGTNEVASEDDEATETDEDAETEEVENTISFGVVETVEEGDDDDEEETVTTTAYLRVGDSSIIYELTSADFESIIACDYDSLRPTDVVSLDWDDVSSVIFTIDGETTEVTVMTWADYVEAYEIDEEDTDEEEATHVYLIGDTRLEFDDVKDALVGLEISSFNDESASSTLELAFTVNVDKEDYPSVTVEIYQVDGENCLVVIDGETVGYIQRSLMVELREAVTSILLGLA